VRASRSTVLGVAGVVALTAVVTVVFVETQEQKIQPAVTEFDPHVSPATMTIEVKKQSDRAYVCTVVVEDVNHDILGTGHTTIPAGSSTVVKQLSVAFTGKPFAAEVTDCDHLS
jgi:hypothetical protein